MAAYIKRARPISQKYLHFYCFNGPPTTEIYTLSLHDALPICASAYLSDWSPCRLADQALVNRVEDRDRKSTRLNSSHVEISYAVFCLKKKSSISRAFSASQTMATERILHHNLRLLSCRCSRLF